MVSIITPVIRCLYWLLLLYSMSGLCLVSFGWGFVWYVGFLSSILLFLLPNLYPYLKIYPPPPQSGGGGSGPRDAGGSHRPLGEKTLGNGPATSLLDSIPMRAAELQRLPCWLVNTHEHVYIHIYIFTSFFLLCRFCNSKNKVMG